MLRFVQKEVGCGYSTVIDVVKGRHWSNYTGILDETTFYRKYSTKITSYLIYLPEIIKLRKDGLTNKEIGEKLNLNSNTIQAITSGVALNKYTEIKHKTRDEQILDGSIPTAKTSIETVLKTVELYKKGENKENISKKLNIPVRRIEDIITGKKWSKLTGIEYKTTGKHILNKKQVLEIVQMKKDGKTNKEISKKFDITLTAVSYILNGKTWSDVTGIKYTPSRKKGEFSASVTKEQVDEIIKLNNDKVSWEKIANKLNIRLNNVRDILTGRTWSEYTKIQKNK